MIITPDTVICKDSEVNERQLQFTYVMAIEAFYEEMLHVLKSNKDLHVKKVEARKEMALHTGACLAIDDAIINLDLIKEHFLDSQNL